MIARSSTGEDAPIDERGDLAQLIAELKATLPGEASNGYVDPTEAEAAAMLQAVALLLAGSLHDAADALAALGYDLVRFHDAPSDSTHLMLCEQQPIRRGWGLYVLSAAPARDLTVEVPHPIWDVFTPELGTEAYLRLGARNFLMAGAHRYANGRGSLVSDVARNAASIFQRLHERLTGSSTHVLQLHGFNHQSYPDYPDVVLSNGSPTPHPELLRLQAAIETRGVPTGVFDGVRWAKLGATQNRQGRHTRAIGGRFYHLESRYRLRNRPELRTALVETIAEALCDSDRA